MGGGGGGGGARGWWYGPFSFDRSSAANSGESNTFGLSVCAYNNRVGEWGSGGIISVDVCILFCKRRKGDVQQVEGILGRKRILALEHAGQRATRNMPSFSRFICPARRRWGRSSVCYRIRCLLMQKKKKKKIKNKNHNTLVFSFFLDVCLALTFLDLAGVRLDELLLAEPWALPASCAVTNKEMVLVLVLVSVSVGSETSPAHPPPHTHRLMCTNLIARSATVPSTHCFCARAAKSHVFHREEHFLLSTVYAHHPRCIESDLRHPLFCLGATTS